MINNESNGNGKSSDLFVSDWEGLTTEGDPTLEEMQKIIADSRNVDGVGFSSAEHDEVARSYQPIPMEIVVKDPESYIYSEILSVCRSLWNKNIDTVQSSDSSDGCYYLEIGTLSDENLAILRDLVNKGVEGYIMNGINIVANRNEVCRITASTPDELQKLADVFVLQDVQKEGFEKVDDFLRRFQDPVSTSEGILMDDGCHIIDAEGYVYNFDPNITLADALKIEHKEELYIPNEGKIYNDGWRLKQHRRYLESLNS